MAVVYSVRVRAKNTSAPLVVEKLTKGEQVKAFSDQVVSPTLAENAALTLGLLLEHDSRGVLHTSGATALDRVEFARKVTERFGLTGEIIPVLTADVKLLAPRPLRSGLDVSRAASLLRSKPLGIDAALELFFKQWRSRGSAR